jgi:hypothetical protein
VAQQRHVIDRVGAGDQRRDFQVRVDPAPPADPHILAGQPVQPGPLGPVQNRRKPRARHEVGVI